MGWESFDVVRFVLGLPSRSNDGSLALVSCLSGGYKFALVLRYIGLVSSCLIKTSLVENMLLCVQLSK